MLIKNIIAIFRNTFLTYQQETINYYKSSDNQKFNYKILIISISVALSLTFINYFGIDPGYPFMIDFLNNIHLHSYATGFNSIMHHNSNPQIIQLFYWCCVIMSFYFLLPILIIKFLLKDKLKNYGFQTGNVFKDYKIYVVMLLCMIPLILIFSGTKSFQNRYPYYRLSVEETLFPYFWIWQTLYFLQFIGVEFFFRGFIVHGFKKQFGYYSVFIMTIPYCMIHFGKPMPETIAAIFAGIVLGTFSLKSNSIWLGVAIHYTVALSMDLAALWRMGYFG